LRDFQAIVFIVSMKYYHSSVSPVVQVIELNLKYDLHVQLER